MPPFNIIRACFYLLAVILLIEVLSTIAGGVMCWWTNFTTIKQIGACEPIVTQIREVWAEVLAAILALLVAAKKD